jgi:hypothetical protein
VGQVEARSYLLSFSGSLEKNDGNFNSFESW